MRRRSFCSAPGLGAEQARTIAAALIEARRTSKKVILPPDLDLALEDGYQIQNAMVAWNVMEGNRVEGWTMEATSPAMRRELAITEPICGPLFSGDIHHFLGENVPTFDFNMLGGFASVEAKFAMQLRYEMPLREEPYTTDEVARAVGSVTPALELRQSRLDTEDGSPPGAAMIAGDAASAGALICGDVWEVTEQVDENVANKWGGGKMNVAALSRLTEGTVAMSVNGVVSAEGMNRQDGEHPLELLTFLINHLLARGIALQPRHVLSTSCALGSQPVAEGQQLLADFGGFGEVRVNC
jgi:2-keto-4-pentenoate hydratase